MPTGLLELRGVSKSFGGTDALAPTTLSVEDGSFVAIVGPSGCGKSTLFNMIAGLLRPDGGDVVLAGASVVGSTGHVGYMLQKDLLVPWRTVEDNITMAARLTRRVTDADRAEARRVADAYGLGDFLRHYPERALGRDAPARRLHAHARHPPAPPAARRALRRPRRPDATRHAAVARSRCGANRVGPCSFITHDVDESIFLSDRVLVMSPRPGRVVADLANLLARPRGVETLTDPMFVAIKSRIMRLLHGGES